MVENSFGSWSN